MYQFPICPYSYFHKCLCFIYLKVITLSLWVSLNTLIGHWAKIFKSISFHFRFGAINSFPSFFSNSRYFTLYCPVYIALSSLCFSQTLLLTFCCHVSLCLAKSVVHPQFLSVASSKSHFKTFNKFLLSHQLHWFLWTFWSSSWKHSWWSLHVVSISFSCKQESLWCLLLSSS